MRANAAPRDAPFALIEKVGGAMRVAATDPSAHALGIVPGLTLADARARIPGLAAIDHDPAADRALLEELADGCDRYSPTVATDPPRGIVIDIVGCLHPFGDDALGETGLAADLRRRFERRGLSPTTAFAATPDAALALATFGGNIVMALPVTALRVDGEIHRALRRAGLRTLDALAKRPRAPLAARFGMATTEALDRLLDRAVPIAPRRHPPEFAVETRFAEPIVQTDAVLATLDELMRRAAAMLAERARGGRRFEAALFRSDGHVARLGIDTGQPTRDAGILARLFRERLDTLADPLDPGFGYDLIRLAVPVTEPLAAEQLMLGGGAVAEAELAALIDRLTIRLGRGRVRRFRAGDSHIPEQAAFDLPITDVAPPVAWDPPEPGEPPLRPLHLFDPPQPIEAIAEVPDGPPFRFRWRRVLHEVRRAEGPERIAAEWWRHHRDAGLTRDYYRVEDQAGRRFWVFRNGLYGVERGVPDWYLHGLFA